MKKAIIYDFDKTVYNGETSINFILFFLSKHPHLILKFIFNLFLILFNIASLEKTKNIFFSILNNIDDNVLDSDISLFWEKERNKIFPYFYNEIKKNKKECDILILISASPDFLLENIYKKLGFDVLIATKYEKYKMVSKNCKNTEKVNRLKLLGEFEVLSFYSDSISDKPLYDIANNKYTIDKNGNILKGIPKKTKWVDKWI